LANTLKNSKTVGRTVFIGSVVTLLIICFAVGSIEYYQINSLQTTNNKLQTDYENLQTIHSQLEATYSQLQSTYAQLQESTNNNLALQNQYNQLQASYNALNTKYQKLLASIPSTNGLLITQVDQNHGVASQAGVISVTLRNVSNETLHITSLKLYDSSQVLQSSKDVLVVLSPNSTTIINQFLRSNNEGVTALFYLKVETLEGYTATSDPLPLGQ